MESLLSDGFVLHQRCSAAAVLRPATGVTFFGGSFAPLSRPLMLRRSIYLSPATASRISASARNGSLISKSMQVGVVSDYDLLALNSISGCGLTGSSMFPEVDSTWKTFNEIQKLSSKTNGKTVGEMMTPAPLVIRETSNLEAAARLLLETKYRRLPVVDVAGKLIGIITRGNVVRAALQLKNARTKRA